jgi:hypothetical protein
MSVTIVTNLTEISSMFKKIPSLFGARPFTYIGLYFRARLETVHIKMYLVSTSISLHFTVINAKFSTYIFNQVSRLSIH